MKLASVEKKSLKIVVLGAKNSGKTALTVRFLTGKFIHEYATGEDFSYPHNLTLNSRKIELVIVDTSQNSVSSAIMDADGIIIVYAINQKKSFSRAKELLSHVRAVNGRIPCIAIVANKLDMWHYRTVMRADGEYLAKKYGCMYFELSALNDSEGVNRMFTVIVKLINDDINNTRLDCQSVIIVDDDSAEEPPQQFEGRQRSRSLQLPDHPHDNKETTKTSKQHTQKSPIIFRRLLRSWNQSVGISRSKSTEKLF